MGNIVFVLGGARSGKSRFAQNRAVSSKEKKKVYYLATAKPGDQEMAERIQKHQDDRPSDWTTIEEPLFPAKVFPTGQECCVILDCITLLITNILMEEEEKPAVEIEKRCMENIKEIIAAARKMSGETIIVSNEVGIGLYSEYPMGRQFQDITGRIHQYIAKEAEDVYFLVAGLPQKLK